MSFIKILLVNKRHYDIFNFNYIYTNLKFTLLLLKNSNQSNIKECDKKSLNFNVLTIFLYKIYYIKQLS